jgi:hypothetical protein
VDGANLVRAVQIATPQPKERAQPRLQREGNDEGQLRDFSQTAAGPAGALHGRWRCLRNLVCQFLDYVLERPSAQLRRAGVQLAQLLDLLLNVRRLFRTRLHLRL